MATVPTTRWPALPPGATGSEMRSRARRTAGGPARAATTRTPAGSVASPYALAWAGDRLPYAPEVECSPTVSLCGAVGRDHILTGECRFTFRPSQTAVIAEQCLQELTERANVGSYPLEQVPGRLTLSAPVQDSMIV